MGRSGTGVEPRQNTIRVNFTTAEGVWQRVTLKLPPTPPNVRYAEKLVQRVRQAIARGTFDWAEYFPESKQAGQQAGAERTFGQWCEKYLKTKGRLALRTRDQYRNALGVWQGLLGADVPIRNLTHGKVAEVVGSTPWASGKLLNNYLIPLRGVFRLAGRDLKLADNPMEGIENSKHQAPPPDPLSLGEMEAVLADLQRNADERVWAYFEFAFMTGMRPEELIELRWGDIDWNNDTARVQRARTSGEVKDLKTHNVRDVDLVSRALLALEVMKRYTQLGGTTDADRELGRQIFQSPVTGKAWHDERSQRDTFWRPALRRCGIRWRRPYQTRHTYATNSLAAQVNPTYVARQLGHANAKMLFTVYAKWIDGSDRGREKAKLEASLKQSGQGRRAA